MKTLFLALMCSSFLSSVAWAVPCSEPGKYRYNVAGSMEFCDGTDWQVIGSSSYAGACAPSNAGRQLYVSGTIRYCDGSLWNVIECAVTASPCAGQAGKQRFNGTMMQYCNGTFWVDMNGGACLPPY